MSTHPRSKSTHRNYYITWTIIEAECVGLNYVDTGFIEGSYSSCVLLPVFGDLGLYFLDLTLVELAILKSGVHLRPHVSKRTQSLMQVKIK